MTMCMRPNTTQLKQARVQAEFRNPVVFIDLHGDDAGRYNLSAYGWMFGTLDARIVST